MGTDPFVRDEKKKTCLTINWIKQVFVLCNHLYKRDRSPLAHWRALAQALLLALG